MDLPQMPGSDQGGYAEFSDQVKNTNCLTAYEYWR